jgi:peptide/nickel transport system permease protein
MIDELNRPWIKVARAKGMPSYRTVGVHAFRNAAGPVVTLAGWDFISMLSGGTVIVEVVFAWPGLGRAALDAVQQRDLVLLQAIVIVIAAITVLLNIVIDIAYKLLDPRVRVQQSAGR